MYRFAFAFIALSLVSNTFAATTKSETSVLHREAPTLLAVKTGFIVGDGEALPGVNAQVVGRLNTEFPFYGGAEMGMFIYSETGASAAVIPVLGTIFTEFEASRTIHPTLGVSAGPAFSTGAGLSAARFSLLFDPGIHFALGGADLLAQVRFGVLGSTFVALPQLGFAFSI